MKKNESSKSNIVNDIHSQLNEAQVNNIFKPNSVEQLHKIILDTLANSKSFCIVGMRHAMGGQQFATDSDMTALNKIIHLDKAKGIIEVESGAMWPAIIDYCWDQQQEGSEAWSIIQKQTGADGLTMGGSRVENYELFKLAIGGYGLFGVITSVKLRLMLRKKMQRIVKLLDIEELISAFEERISQGYIYGDFQYMTDHTSPKFLKEGVFSCYLPVEDEGNEVEDQSELSIENWKTLYKLGFTNKTAAYEAYSQYYLSSNKQLYWSDTHQLSIYLDDYHVKLNKELGVGDKASLMISEIYVPRKDLVKFMSQVREMATKEDFDIFYGTIRLIKQDNESFLAWAKEDYVCIIFNLRVLHSKVGLEKAQKHFRALIDSALVYSGSYYLTYHRWARKDQVLAGYPQFPEFMRMKQKYDPNDIIQSDWYRHYKNMFA